MVAVRATIKSDFDPKLSGTPDCSYAAQSNACVNLTLLPANTVPLGWAQMGYYKYRKQGSKRIYGPVIYFEVWANGKQEYITDKLMPTSTAAIDYWIRLDPTTGTITGSINGATWFSRKSTWWKNRKADTFQVFGEIVDKDTDMVGTPTVHCQFSQCKYDIGNGLVDADLTNGGTAYSSDPNQWQSAIINSTNAEVWDLNPLP
jgi:hypothetical protein